MLKSLRDQINWSTYTRNTFSLGWCARLCVYSVHYVVIDDRPIYVAPTFLFTATNWREALGININTKIVKDMISTYHGFFFEIFRLHGIYVLECLEIAIDSIDSRDSVFIIRINMYVDVDYRWMSFLIDFIR